MRKVPKPSAGIDAPLAWTIFMGKSFLEDADQLNHGIDRLESAHSSYYFVIE
jgi:hypothetical protein